jgi:hypothetical protein
MKTTKRDAMMERIEKHGRQLIELFGMDKDTDPVKLCKRLRRLEGEASRAAVQYCNGEIDGEQWERSQEGVIAKLREIIDPIGGSLSNVPVLVNGDPRGYALKIDDCYMRKHTVSLHQDWGGYGIIAPDLTESS